MIKNYLLDTNILLSNPKSIYGFEDNNVYICGTTLQELNFKKDEPGEIGYNARESCRILDELRKEGDLTTGVPLKTGGTLYIEPNGIDQDLLPKGYSLNIADNRIISTCLYLNKTIAKQNPITLLTNDVAMRVNASICGLRSEAVRNDHVKESGYTGHIDLEVDGSLINNIYANGTVKTSEFPDLINYEFVTMHSGKQSALSVFIDGEFKVVKEKSLFGGIKPLNKMQTYAIWALTEPVEKVPLVIMEGPAGTSKTFLSLAAGLSQTYLGQGGRTSGEYENLLISRPNTQTSDRDFGFLPGELDAKMAPLIAAYKDNLTEILKIKNKEEDMIFIKNQIEDWFISETIELCPLYSIRGRSLHNRYMICDEAQNATKLLIKDVVTRAGRNTKIVLAGDPGQCDVPTLDRYNNGLVYCEEVMKGVVPIIKFDSPDYCVRSKLAEIAIDRFDRFVR